MIIIIILCPWGLVRRPHLLPCMLCIKRNLQSRPESIGYTSLLMFLPCVCISNKFRIVPCKNENNIIIPGNVGIHLFKYAKSTFISQFFFPRSKSSIISSPGVTVIEESPRRSFYSSLAPSSSRFDAAPSTIFKTPPSTSSGRQFSPQVFVKKDPSPATLHSLLHGEIVSPSWTPGSGHGLLSHTTPPLGVVMEEDSSPELFSAGSSTSGGEGVGERRRGRNRCVARSLNYGDGEEEEEEEEEELATPVSSRSTPGPLFTPQKSILKTPERRTQTPKKSVSFWQGLDPALENESASMVAFALSTPTKEEPLSFSGVLRTATDYNMK